MKKGFSYIEILIALAVFSIVLLPLLPLLSQAFHNEEYAQESYAYQLHAQSLMSVTRGCVIKNRNIGNETEEYYNDLNNPPYAYRIWYGDSAYGSDLPENFTEEPQVTLNHLPGKVIIVICWDEGGKIYGRASGIVPEGLADE